MTGQGTIVATGSIAYPVGPRRHRRDDRRGEGHDDDLDLRPPHHPGRRVGALPRADRGAPAGRARLLRGGLRGPRRRARTGAVPARARRRRGRRQPPAAPASAAGEELLQAVQAATQLRQARPQPRPPRRAPRPARLRARGRPRPRPRGARPDAGAAGEDPRAPVPDVRPGRDARRRAAAPARDLLRHDRLRDRAHRLAPPARVAARAHRVRRLPPRADERRTALAAQAPGRGRRARALHAQGLPRPAPVLDRGPRHDRADARRADPAVGGPRRPGGRRRDGPPRPAERAGPQPRPRLRHDLRRVRGRLDARGRDDDPAGRHRRRQVPPRRAGHLPAARRRDDPRQPRVEPEPPRVRLRRRRGRHARGADLPPRARTPTRTRTRPCRS